MKGLIDIIKSLWGRVLDVPCRKLLHSDLYHMQLSLKNIVEKCSKDFSINPGFRLKEVIYIPKHLRDELFDMNVLCVNGQVLDTVWYLKKGAGKRIAEMLTLLDSEVDARYDSWFEQN